MLKRLSPVKAIVLPIIVGLAVIAGGVALSLASSHHADESIYLTRPGEQQVIELPDHSLVYLEASTEIKVRSARGRIDLELVAGEILCDVRPNSARVFHVSVAEGELEELGTQFAVARQGGEALLSVIEGEVWLSGSADRRAWKKVAGGHNARILADGRVFGELETGRYDDVAVERKPHNFTRSTIAEAAEVLNRESPDLRIVITGSARERPIQGQFAGAEEFVKALRGDERLDVTQNRRIIVVKER